MVAIEFSLWSASILILFFSSSLLIIVEFFLILSKSFKDNIAISAKLDFLKFVNEFFPESKIIIIIYCQICWTSLALIFLM